MRRLSVAALLALAAAVASPALAQPVSEHGVYAGCWEYRASVAFIPVSTEYRQLGADEIDAFLFNPCTRHYRCSYPQKTVGDGKVLLRGVWTDKKGRDAPVTAKGSYSPKTLKLTANVHTINGFNISGTINGKWVGVSCPAT